MLKQEVVKHFSISESFCNNLYAFSKQFSHIAWLDSRRDVGLHVGDSSENKIEELDLLVAFGKKSELLVTQSNPNDRSTFQQLKCYLEQSKWAFGHLSYDLKNNLQEGLVSNNSDGLDFPDLHFFEPKVLVKISKGMAEVSSSNENLLSQITQLNELNSTPNLNDIVSEKPTLQTTLSKEEYLNKIKAIKTRIQKGDVYEVNFCHEFFSKGAEVDPYDLYQSLVNYSPTPFSSFVKMNDKFIICASPERFLKKTGNRLLSQPIKGTIKRGATVLEDEELKKQLKSSSKERSENVMIVDLVRNDLSQIAVDGTVAVDELCGIYTFPQVHQMISTVSCKLKKNIHFVDAIADCFPMGSMTGAPKFKAMQIIEEMEETKRGAYSGSVGYFTPEGDFDFNVVIRSLLYNAETKYLSFSAGGAITVGSDAESEYEEVLLKAKAVFEILG